MSEQTLRDWLNETNLIYWYLYIKNKKETP